jgi:hypothetical protein
VLIEIYYDIYRRLEIIFPREKEALSIFSGEVLPWIIILTITYLIVCIYNLDDPKVPLISEAAKLQLKRKRGRGMDIKDGSPRAERKLRLQRRKRESERTRKESALRRRRRDSERKKK